MEIKSRESSSVDDASMASVIIGETRGNAVIDDDINDVSSENAENTELNEWCTSDLIEYEDKLRSDTQDTVLHSDEENEIVKNIRQEILAQMRTEMAGELQVYTNAALRNSSASSATAASGCMSTRSNAQEFTEQQQSDELEPAKLRREMDKVRKLDKILLKRMDRERRVKRERLALQKRLRDELKSLENSDAARNKSAASSEVHNNEVKFLALVPPPRHNQGIKLEPEHRQDDSDEFQALFQTEINLENLQSENSESSAGARDAINSGSMKNSPLKAATPASPSSSSQASSFPVASSSTTSTTSRQHAASQTSRRSTENAIDSEKNFIKKNIELAKAYGEVIAISEEDRARIDRILSDLDDMTDAPPENSAQRGDTLELALIHAGGNDQLYRDNPFSAARTVLPTASSPVSTCTSMATANLRVAQDGQLMQTDDVTGSSRSICAASGVSGVSGLSGVSGGSSTSSLSTRLSEIEGRLSELSKRRATGRGGIDLRGGENARLQPIREVSTPRDEAPQDDATHTTARSAAHTTATAEKVCGEPSLKFVKAEREQRRKLAEINARLRHMQSGFAEEQEEAEEGEAEAEAAEVMEMEVEPANQSERSGARELVTQQQIGELLQSVICEEFGESELLQSSTSSPTSTQDDDATMSAVAVMTSCSALTQVGSYIRGNPERISNCFPKLEPQILEQLLREAALNGIPHAKPAGDDDGGGGDAIDNAIDGPTQSAGSPQLLFRRVSHETPNLLNSTTAQNQKDTEKESEEKTTSSPILPDIRINQNVTGQQHPTLNGNNNNNNNDAIAASSCAE